MYTTIKKKYPNYRVYSNRTRLIDDDVFHLKQSVGGFNDIQCSFHIFSLVMPCYNDSSQLYRLKSF